MTNGGIMRGTLWLLGIFVVSLGCQKESDMGLQPASEPPSKPAPVSAQVIPLKSTVNIDVSARRPAMKLSEYGLFEDMTKQIPSAGVIPYVLNAWSFVDNASQRGLVYIPPDQTAGYQSDQAFTFPTGSVLIQHIRFPLDQRHPAEGDRLVETRLLIHMAKGWVGVPYLWNDDFTDAERSVIGAKTDINWTRSDGTPGSFKYVTPNMNECKRCHVNEDRMLPIGVTAANLNQSMTFGGSETNQLKHWQALGLLEGVPDDVHDVPRLPDWRDASAATVERRARCWLDVNCSHCHNPHGPASTSGLDLTFGQDQPVRYGVYKPPVAAGRGSQGLRFSIVPGRPDESFLVHRIGSVELGVMMPPLGRSGVDHEGVALIRAWITEMQVDEALAEAALNPMKAYQDASVGGDAERGRVLFHKVQKCVTCHRVGDTGGSVGPDLSDVGKRTKRQYLLESIVLPSAKIVKGFETQVFVMADGRVITGTVQSEDQLEVVIRDARHQTRIEKAQIDDRVVSEVSTMPSMANLLTVDNVRDLIAYLVTLQTTPKE
jgi:uncharacterized repeat protein (TIGR03806 family)